MAAAESYPDDLRYHPAHDWARVEEDEATLGITWYAQDFGELVHYEPPDVGATLAKESVRRGRVGQGQHRSHLATVRRGRGGQPESCRRARGRKRGLYLEGWLVRIRMSDPTELDGLLSDGNAYQQLRRLDAARSQVSSLSLTDVDREQMLAAIGVSSVDERCSATSRAAFDLDRELVWSPRSPSPSSMRISSSLPPGMSAPAESSRSSAQASTTTTCPPSST